jgi:NADPH-dependent glutamate synthase beta subunit-like oxidoreductase
MLLQDINKFPSDKEGRVALYKILDDNNARYINYPQWEHIDAAEVAAGEPKGKPREKFTRRDEMLTIANA